MCISVDCAYIVYPCTLRGYRNKNTPVATRTLRMWVSKYHYYTEDKIIPWEKWLGPRAKAGKVHGSTYLVRKCFKIWRGHVEISQKPVVKYKIMWATEESIVRN